MQQTNQPPVKVAHCDKIKMESQGQRHEGKRNFNKKKWRETQYSHKERGNTISKCRWTT